MTANNYVRVLTELTAFDGWYIADEVYKSINK